MTNLSEIFELPTEYHVKHKLNIDTHIGSLPEAILYTVYIQSRYDYSVDILKDFNSYTKSLGYDLSFLNRYDYLVTQVNSISEESVIDLLMIENTDFYEKLSDYITNKKYLSENFSEQFCSIYFGSIQIRIFSVDYLVHECYNWEKIMRYGIPLDSKTISITKLIGEQ